MEKVSHESIASGYESRLRSLISSDTFAQSKYRMQVSDASSDEREMRASYESIINNLLAEREEAIEIAQYYQGELARVKISDEDIASLNASVTAALDVLASFSNVDREEFKNSVEPLKGLITPDILKTLQLLGFNFKEAIGQPLTEVCASAIRKLDGRTGQPNKSKQTRRQR